MAQDVSESEISQTFKNLLFLDINSSVLGLPVNLDTPQRRSQARIQDGLGNSSPLLLSRTGVSVTSAPEDLDSVARFNEIVNSATVSQNNSLVWS